MAVAGGPGRAGLARLEGVVMLIKALLAGSGRREVPPLRRFPVSGGRCPRDPAGLCGIERGRERGRERGGRVGVGEGDREVGALGGR